MILIHSSSRDRDGADRMTLPARKRIREVQITFAPRPVRSISLAATVFHRLSVTLCPADAELGA
ncbi:hypothetical protein V22_08690 [Calycomorphotria hydatis]|uniref:Uncharacterized protein n=1 Tax=Calycomorphotria hydatis TaxID=2528027 RepID=A0A517T5I4_9PLAN|nr:hypothetical protein V22_08690 [Calycomorphotria hydatis]